MHLSALKHMASSMVDPPPPSPLKFFCPHIQTCPPNIIFRKNCPTYSSLEIMTFRYLKTLVFDKFVKKLQHCLMFSFLKSIICDN